MIARLTASLWIGWEDWLGGPWKQEEAGLLPQGWKGGEEAEGWAWGIRAGWSGLRCVSFKPRGFLGEIQNGPRTRRARRDQGKRQSLQIGRWCFSRARKLIKEACLGGHPMRRPLRQPALVLEVYMYPRQRIFTTLFPRLRPWNGSQWRSSAFQGQEGARRPHSLGPALGSPSGHVFMIWTLRLRKCLPAGRSWPREATRGQGLKTALLSACLTSLYSLLILFMPGGFSSAFNTQHQQKLPLASTREN